jgi:hypothetical protein
MIPLAISVAVFDKLTCLTCLETDASLLAAVGTAMDHLICDGRLRYGMFELIINYSKNT